MIIGSKKWCKERLIYWENVKSDFEKDETKKHLIPSVNMAIENMKEKIKELK